ncbi:MAG: hypothetical protein JSV65_11685 [Armatimonadota bacterium]|nr:MAG: hypothetical protein JSV65_11685 [Armatimonadota bacterium]
MKVVAHSVVSAHVPYLHLGYISASTANTIEDGLTAITRGSVLLIACVGLAIIVRIVTRPLLTLLVRAAVYLRHMPERCGQRYPVARRLESVGERLHRVEASRGRRRPFIRGHRSA